jgi:hypothetical protein
MSGGNRKTLQIVLYQLDEDEVCDLNDILEAVPPDLRDRVEVALEMKGDHDFWGATVKVYYTREETDAEVQQREREERERKARYAAEEWARERAVYEQLKRKFGE